MMRLHNIIQGGSRRFRILMILFLAVGYLSGLAASNLAPEQFCGVAAPCEDSPTHADNHDQDDAEAGDDCCASDCSDCYFCFSGPSVSIPVPCEAAPLPSSEVIVPRDEIPLSLATPPLDQPPRFRNYPAV